MTASFMSLSASVVSVIASYSLTISEDYGAPFTLAEAQEYLSKSAIGDRITWHFADPGDYLKETSADGEVKTWDIAVLAHCIWYFDRTETLSGILQSLKGRVKRVLIAEYALKATLANARPHVLAGITRATLEAHSVTSEANIRCMTSPKAIKKIATSEQWNLEIENEIIPIPGLLDGYWEAGGIKGGGDEEWDKEIETAGVYEPRVVTMLRSSRDPVVRLMDELKGEKVTTMDVWVGSFS